MIDFSSAAIRRDPFPAYAELRRRAPVFQDPATGLWLVLDYDGVKRVLSEPETFSSRYGPPWLVFVDPPRHTQLRALITRAFTPRSAANLEPRIRELSRRLLNQQIESGVMDLALDYAIPLPMMVIADMLGIPAEDHVRFKGWTDAILCMSYTIASKNSPEGQAATVAFFEAGLEMSAYLARLLDERRTAPRDDLLTRLLEAEVDGARLGHEEILGFFQLLLLAGSETTTNLINNAMLCFSAHPEQLARVRTAPELLPAALEEVLRYRSPVQWMYRVTTRAAELHGRTIPEGQLLLAMLGAANRDPQQFPEPARFDGARSPNPHLAFGHGIHFCLEAPLARLEAKLAVGDLLQRLQDFRLASAEPWEPRQGAHVHGPSRLPIRFEPGEIKEI